MEKNKKKEIKRNDNMKIQKVKWDDMFRIVSVSLWYSYFYLDGGARYLCTYLL